MTYGFLKNRRLDGKSSEVFVFLSHNAVIEPNRGIIFLFVTANWCHRKAKAVFWAGGIRWWVVV